MPNIAVVGDLLPLIGTPAFLPSLLSYIRNSPSRTLPLDPVIFQAILLCIVAGDKHLLLHTLEEDIGLVVRLAAWVSIPRFQSLDTVLVRRRFIARQLPTSLIQGCHMSAACPAIETSSFRLVLAFPRDIDETTAVQVPVR
jgi:hypothetical protein